MRGRFGSVPRQTKRELRQLQARVERVERATIQRLMAQEQLDDVSARIRFVTASRAQRDAWVREAGFDPATGKRL